MAMMRKRTITSGIVAVVCALIWGVHAKSGTISAASPADITTAGEFIVDPPTLINLGFEWFIQGDENRNASVDVSYRKQGSGEWKAALPLLRLQGGRIKQGDQIHV